MKIFSASQIRDWDAYAIENEPITSVGLMNRAAGVFTDWFVKKYNDSLRPVLILAGTGNNGGDGIAIGRMLDQAQYGAKVVVCDFGGKHSVDFDAQIALLSPFSAVQPTMATSFAAAREIIESSRTSNTVIIDALFGAGLNRPLSGEWAQLIDYLNELNGEIVSVDLPSGLLSDTSSKGNAVLKAARTLSFQTPKLAFFFPENAEYVGKWSFRNIGLHPDYEAITASVFHFLTQNEAVALVKPRAKFSHKGNFGHALLIAGSWGKMGAAVLAAKACLRAGVGLLTVHAPHSGNVVLQTAVPEAMASMDHQAKHWSETLDLEPYACIGVGPGIGKSRETVFALETLLSMVQKPVVLDADALNLLAENPGWFKLLPQNSILTPHPKEFERLFGNSANDFERNQLQRAMAQKYQVIIVLKGANTAIALPDGTCWFNSTGNAGMATGGSGDVLTGIITGLLAQGYSPQHAALLGVFLHGRAGDLAAAVCSQEALIAGQLVDYLGKAWLSIG